MNRSQRPAPRLRTAQTLGFLVLVGCLAADSARAETITESEPNGSVITADHTLGPEPLGIVATLDPADDQDYFDFEVRTVGNGGVVRVEVDPGFSPYSFELVGPTAQIFSGDFAEPRIFDFAPAFLGGQGRYSMRIAGRTTTAPIPYQVEITTLPGGSGEAPPTIAGTLAAPLAIPTASSVGLALLTMAIAGGGLAALRRRHAAS